MNHEKVFKRPDGSRVSILATVAVDHSKTYWKVSAWKCEPGKRKFMPVGNTDSYSWRSLSMAERERADRESVLEACTEQEVSETLNELYQLIKPNYLSK